MIRQDSPRRMLRELRRRRDSLKLRMMTRAPELRNVCFEEDEYHALNWAVEQLTPLHEQYVLGLPNRKPKLVPKND